MTEKQEGDDEEWTGVEITEDGYIPLPKGSKPSDSCILQHPNADCKEKVTPNNLTLDNGIPERPETP